jgi:hypothetical protein
MVRTIAGHDYQAAQAVMRWPLVELLHAYLHRLRQQALEDYKHRLLMWASNVAHRKDKKAPDPPSILDP